MSNFFVMSAMPFPHTKENIPYKDKEAIKLANKRIDNLTLEEIEKPHLDLVELLTYVYGVEDSDDPNEWLANAKATLKEIFAGIVDDRDSPFIISVTYDKPRLFTGEIISSDYGNDYVQLLEIFVGLNIFNEPATEEEILELGLTVD